MVLPSPGFCHHGGCECSFFPQPVPCKSLCMGQEENKVFVLPAPFTQAVCILPGTSVPQVCAALLLSRIPSLSGGFGLWLFGSWQPRRCQPSRAPNPGNNLAHPLTLCVPAGTSVPAPCTGTFVTRLSQELVALLMEHGYLICRLYSSDSRELSVLMLHSLSFSPR